MTMHAGVGALFNANEPYELRCDTKLRSFWVELPRQAFASRFDSQRPPLTAHLNLSRGLGRIAVEFCSALALEGANLDPQSRAKLGEQFMDILALAISAEPDRRPVTEPCAQSGRLLLVKNYIDEHLSDPDLSLGDIAKKNGVSLRTLHQLFHPMGMSASEWLRTRRLQRCYDLLSSPQHETKTITEIAYSMGFNSSSHFSNLFRAQFGLRPVGRRGGRPPCRVFRERRRSRQLRSVAARRRRIAGSPTMRRTLAFPAQPAPRGASAASRKRQSALSSRRFAVPDLGALLRFRAVPILAPRLQRRGPGPRAETARPARRPSAWSATATSALPSKSHALSRKPPHDRG